VLIDFHRVPGKSTEWVMNHVWAGQEVFKKEITECGFKRIQQLENLWEENYLLIFEKRDIPMP
jgi:hypothetical protein